MSRTILCLCFVMLVLFGDCFLFYSIECLYENDVVRRRRSDVEYAEVEEFQDIEHQQALVEGKSLLHSRLSYYNMHFNYTVIYFLFCIQIGGSYYLRFD
jgi:hypothetical protein